MAENSDGLLKTIVPLATLNTAAATTLRGGATPNLKQIAIHTIAGVLGRPTREGDIKALQMALDDSFEAEEKNGRDVYKHVPRAYPVVGASDLGAGVSGAQYSLVNFAKALHDQTQPLIRNLYSLDQNVDETEVEAAKAIFRTTWDEFIAELSREGGPRVSVANVLAKSIFNEAGANKGTGHLHSLGLQLGVINDLNPAKDGFVFARQRVVTKDEEGYLTNFIALTDYYFAVASAWRNYEKAAGKDLGSGLLGIERTLAVISATVNEVYTVMDFVGIDQQERLVIKVGFANEYKDLTIEEFLSWVSTFASREAPALITEGGKRGIKAIIPTATKLAVLSGEFRALIDKDNTALPQLRQDFMLNPLSELKRYIEELGQRATDMTT